jgi:fermentation-respiration switch protein FrsA (DUF1100 family)
MSSGDLKKESQVSKQKISFQSEELKVVGNLFRPVTVTPEEDVSLPAVLVAGAMTGVKEQVAGNYAERIAKAGCNHIDLYDNEKYVYPATNKIIEWFTTYLHG